MSGVTKFLSGTATQPTCTTTNTGHRQHEPDADAGCHGRVLSTRVSRSSTSTRNPNLPEEDQLHFNPRAFAMAQPLSATVGNFGNVPLGILRHPGFWNWDLTLARRFPVPQLGATRRRGCSCSCTTSSTSAQFTTMNTGRNLAFQDDPRSRVWTTCC